MTSQTRSRARSLMDFRITSDSPSEQRTGCIVVGVFQGCELSPAALELDHASGHAISRVLGRGDLEGTLGTTLLIHDVSNLGCERVLLVGLGCEREFHESSYRTALDSAIRTLRKTGAAEATIVLNELPVNGRDTAWKIEQAVLAVTDGLYRFDRLKSKPSEAGYRLKKVVVHVANRAEAATADAAIARAAAIAEGIGLAKDLGNLPGNICARLRIWPTRRTSWANATASR